MDALRGVFPRGAKHGISRLKTAEGLLSAIKSEKLNLPIIGLSVRFEFIFETRFDLLRREARETISDRTKLDGRFDEIYLEARLAPEASRWREISGAPSPERVP